LTVGLEVGLGDVPGLTEADGVALLLASLI